MLELALLNADELRHIFIREVTKETNKYYWMENFFDYEFIIEPNEWRRIQYVSKDSEGRILVYFGAWINRSFNIVERLEIFNLSGKPNVIATRDFIRFLEILFCQRQFRKVVFYVIKDNPAVKLYEKFIVDNKIGKIVGVFEKQCISTDGNCYDQIIFEMYKDNFVEWFNNVYKKI